MSSKRGDVELAAVMRKVLLNAEFVSIDAHDEPTLLTIDDLTISVTEDEHQAIEEALS